MSGKLSTSIKKLLTMGENTVGISFTDKAIYCALGDVATPNSKAKFLEHKIDEGIIIGGIVQDYDKFAIHVKEALKEINTPVTFSVISIPSTLIFSSIVHIPISTDNQIVLEKAIGLMLNVELPWKKEESYSDYVVHEKRQDICVSIFAAQKSIIDPYIKAVEATNIHVLAVEFDAVSTHRLMKFYEKERLAITATEKQANIIVTNNDVINFIFSIPIEGVPDKANIESEVSRIKNYYSLETGQEIANEDITLELKQESIEKLADKISDINFYPALGAASRTCSLKGRDNNVSLLDLHPNILYRYFRFLSSLNLIRKSTILISVILICIHVLFFSILSSIAERNSIFSSQPPKIYSSVTTIKNETKQLNAIISMGGLIANQTHRYLPKLLKVDSLFTEGVYPSSINILEINSPINITATAATRTQYNSFRTSLSATHGVKIINFPLGSLNLQNNIPFTVSLNITDTK